MSLPASLFQSTGGTLSRALLILLLPVCLTLSACGGDDNGSGSDGGTPPTPAPQMKCAP